MAHFVLPKEIKVSDRPLESNGFSKYLKPSIILLHYYTLNLKTHISSISLSTIVTNYKYDLQPYLLQYLDHISLAEFALFALFATFHCNPYDSR